MKPNTPNSYVTTLTVDQVFIDRTYQRDCDTARVQKMAANWDRQLLGIVEVSDRGTDTCPRYAVVDGQHRWAAAKLLSETPMLVANVHSNLTLPQEAALFVRLNRERKQPSTWDHWKARRAAGDATVHEIEDICRSHHIVIDMAAQKGCCSCVATLEQLFRVGGRAHLDDTLDMITDVWSLRRDSLEAAIIKGLSLVLRYLADRLDYERLTEALLDTTPREVQAEAEALAERINASRSIRHAMAIVSRYNRRPGPKLRVTARDFRGPASLPQPKELKFPERYCELSELGYADWEIAKRMNINLSSLERQLFRYQMPINPTLVEMAHEERRARSA